MAAKLETPDVWAHLLDVDDGDDPETELPDPEGAGPPSVVHRHEGVLPPTMIPGGPSPALLEVQVVVQGVEILLDRLAVVGVLEGLAILYGVPEHLALFALRRPER